MTDGDATAPIEKPVPDVVGLELHEARTKLKGRAYRIVLTQAPRHHGERSSTLRVIGVRPELDAVTLICAHEVVDRRGPMECSVEQSTD